MNHDLMKLITAALLLGLFFAGIQNMRSTKTWKFGRTPIRTQMVYSVAFSDVHKNVFLSQASSLP